MKKKIISVLLIFTMLVMNGCSVSIDTSSESKEDLVTSGGITEKELTDLPVKWDLTVLFADEDAFESDMRRVEELIPDIEALKGTLNSVEGILNLMENPSILEIKAIMNNAYMYAYFLNSLNSTDPWAQKAMARYEQVNQKEDVAMAFKDAEIMEMPLEKRKEIFSDERLAPYAYYLRKYTDPDYVVRSEEVSATRSLMESATDYRSIRDIFDYVELPKLPFTYPDGTEGILTDPEYDRIMESNEYDHEFRKEIDRLYNEMRLPFANTYAALLEGEMKANWTYAQLDGFDSTLKDSLYDEDVDPVIFDKIIELGHDLEPEISRYCKIKKEFLGQDELMTFDLIRPSGNYVADKISYEDAVNLGRKGVSVWGDEYLESFDKIIKQPHIDVYPSSTKRTGAYMALEGNGTTPFVLFNYTGSEQYTHTIVHEMGHAVYALWSTENQNIYNCSPSIFTHEVASVTNEVMFYNYMTENAETDEEKLFWLDNEINMFRETIFDRSMYSEFEDYCYKTIENGGSLEADAMEEKWVELMKTYYGDEVTVTDDMGIFWAVKPHFYYDYYVYKYATSAAYAASICGLVDKKGQEEVDAYCNFLKAGKTADPASLLAIAGVDPLKDDTYDVAHEYIGELIDEYAALAGNILQ